MKRLSVHRAVSEAEDAKEIVSAWSADGRLYVSLDLGWGRTEPTGPLTDEEAWGFLLADLAVHAANALHQKSGYPISFILDQIQEKISLELAGAHPVAGKFAEGSRQ